MNTDCKTLCTVLMEMVEASQVTNIQSVNSLLVRISPTISTGLVLQYLAFRWNVTYEWQASYDQIEANTGLTEATVTRVVADTKRSQPGTHGPLLSCGVIIKREHFQPHRFSLDVDYFSALVAEKLDLDYYFVLDRLQTWKNDLQAAMIARGRAYIEPQEEPSNVRVSTALHPAPLLADGPPPRPANSVTVETDRPANGEAAPSRQMQDKNNKQKHKKYKAVDKLENSTSMHTNDEAPKETKLTVASELLLDAGVYHKIACEFGHVEEARVRAIIEAAQRPTVKSPAGFIVRALRENWEIAYPPAAEKPKQAKSTRHVPPKYDAAVSPSERANGGTPNPNAVDDWEPPFSKRLRENPPPPPDPAPIFILKQYLEDSMGRGCMALHAEMILEDDVLTIKPQTPRSREWYSLPDAQAFVNNIMSVYELETRFLTGAENA